MIGLVIIAVAAVVIYGVGCLINAARQGRTREWVELFKQAWRADTPP